MKNDSQSGVFSLKAPRMRGCFVAAAAVEQRFAFLATVAAEVFVQQVDHRPQVAAFFHVHLEQVAQVVLARRRSGRGGVAAPRWRARCRPASR